jgi:hypothetical protein
MVIVASGSEQCVHTTESYETARLYSRRGLEPASALASQAIGFQSNATCDEVAIPFKAFPIKRRAPTAHGWNSGFQTSGSPFYGLRKDLSPSRFSPAKTPFWGVFWGFSQNFGTFRRTNLGVFAACEKWWPLFVKRNRPF